MIKKIRRHAGVASQRFSTTNLGYAHAIRTSVLSTNRGDEQKTTKGGKWRTINLRMAAKTWMAGLSGQIDKTICDILPKIKAPNKRYWLQATLWQAVAELVEAQGTAWLSHISLSPPHRKWWLRLFLYWFYTDSWYLLPYWLQNDWIIHKFIDFLGKKRTYWTENSRNSQIGEKNLLIIRVYYSIDSADWCTG